MRFQNINNVPQYLIDSHNNEIRIGRLCFPVNLIRDAKGPSTSGWIANALLLDRASISRQNGYIEPDGTIRLYFTLEQAQTKLHRSRQSATRIFRELEYSGLIIRKKQGLGKPALITLNYPADAKLITKEGEDVQA